MKKLLITICLVLAAFAMVSAQNPRNVLIYNITDTDCGPCSCMDSLYRNVVLPAHPQTIVVAFHSVMMNSYFNKYQGDSVFKTFHAMYEPSGFIDGLGYDTPHFYIADSVTSRYAASPEAPVKIEVTSKTWNPGTRKVDLAFKATNLTADMAGSFWFNVVVTESNIKHLHRTYTGCSTPDMQGLPFRNNYFNNWVTRKMEYWSKGDSLIGPGWNSQQSVTRNCSIWLDTGWVPENCDLVVMIYKKADSLYKSPVQQAIRQSVTGGAGVPVVSPETEGIVKICPNPAKGLTNIHVAVAKPGDCTLQIFDMDGRMVENLIDHHVDIGIYNVEFNTDNYAPGSYVCVFKTPSGQTRKSLIIR